MELKQIADSHARRSFIGGSDARIIMGDDEENLVRLWSEKRGEIEPEDLSGNLIVQLGTVTEDLNRCWYERNRWTCGDCIGRSVSCPTSDIICSSTQIDCSRGSTL
jgi:predicted phage-related endonuclease